MSIRLRALALALVAVFALPARADQEPVDFFRMPWPTEGPASAQLLPKFRFLSTTPARWPGPYRWRYNPAGAPATFADTGTTVAALARNLDAWTAVCAFTHVYEGVTATPPNRRLNEQPDFESVVGWGTLEGRTAGVTYSWYTPGGGVRDLVDSDVILSPTLVDNTFQMDRTAKHEWGHALGLSHSDRGAMLMSGPPDTLYSNQFELQYDDIRGCRCLYGAPATNPAGYACTVPASLDFGNVPAGAPSAPRAIEFANQGNGPLFITAAPPSSAGTLVVGGNCAAGSAVPPGSSCTMTVAASAASAGQFSSAVTLETSDGPYRIDVSFMATAAPPPGTQVAEVVEYLHTTFGHYFVTSLAGEIQALDTGALAGWQRTGRTFRVWSQPQAAPQTAPVCRFFSARFAPKSSHFYTASAQECALVKSGNDWQYEGDVFHVALPDGQGACAAGTVPVYRLYNEGLSGAPNHRFTVDPAVRSAMVAQGWKPEGTGLGVTMCAAP
jgi:hypothetical protein